MKTDKKTSRTKSEPTERSRQLKTFLVQMKVLSVDPAQIREERKKAGMTQAQMANALSISTRTYEEYESGRADMHPNHWFVMRCIAQVHAAPRLPKKRKRAH